MIKWVPRKNINLDNINKKIKDIYETNIFTNNGLNVQECQKKIKQMFNINENKDILMVCNGAMGLNALANGYNMLYNKKLRWAVQSFTFPCSVQYAFENSIVIDIDINMGPDIKKLTELVNLYDGVVVTNCFGNCTNIKLYEDFCAVNNKILIFDNAASPYTFLDNKCILNYGNACMVSLHHTKPIGFGEGGFIVFDKNMKNNMEKTICFGYTSINKIDYDVFASNCKMSEIACIFINEYLNNLHNIFNHHTKLTQYFIDEIKRNNITNVSLFKNYANYNESLLSCLPIILSKYSVDLSIFTEKGIEAKKYYKPLDSSYNSNELYKNIICLPLTVGMDTSDIEIYISILKNI
jgi:dTDP-4-amino-4,6-dideoxygalactose transaminase